MNKETGGPAFPVPGLSGLANNEFIYPMTGMTLRDYFAAKAMQGFFSSQLPTMGEINKKGFVNVAQFSSWAAYEYADAMLKARSA